jgi:hypothetical protein
MSEAIEIEAEIPSEIPERFYPKEEVHPNGFRV